MKKASAGVDAAVPDAAAEPGSGDGAAAPSASGVLPSERRLLDRIARLEAALEESREREARLGHAIRVGRVSIAFQDEQLRYRWLQSALFDERRFVGKTDADLLSAGEAERLASIKRRVLETGEAAEERLRLVVDGRAHAILLRVAPGRDAGVGGIVCTAIDLTADDAAASARERLLAEREVERAWLLAVIERSPVGILLVELLGDGSDRITANERAANLLGHPVDPTRARIVISGRLLRADGTPMSFPELPSSRALRGERLSLEEAILRQPSGREIPILVSAGPIVEADGRFVGAVVTFDDISALKELERMREQWTSLITHDLRQPITSISGFANVLVAHPDTPDHLRGKLVHIMAAARRLGRMTSDLLEISRLDSAQLALERHPTDLPQLVQDVIERLAPELQDHPVRVEVRGALPVLEIDPERFEQILGNLFSNAAKYGTPGTEILVELERRAGEVVVGVTNAGDGLPPDQLSQVFARWHRSPAARKSRVRGMGLGLYIARGLVEAHGGRIWAETEPGRTVTFRIALPLAREP